jgi:hypothetical protein
MTLAMVLGGLAVVAAGLVDLAWTTITAGSGAGPLSRRLARFTWRTALAVHRRRPSHRFLAAAGGAARPAKMVRGQAAARSRPELDTAA